MSESREIEIKLNFNDEEKVKEVLRREGGRKIKERTQEDIYFGEERDMRQGKDLLRIRDTDSGTLLTLKAKNEGNETISDRLEISTKIEDKKPMTKILKSMGLNPIDRKKSKREIWESGSIKITFVKFLEPKTLEFMEVEGNSRKEVKDFEKKFGDLVEEVGEEIFEKFD